LKTAWDRPDRNEGDDKSVDKSFTLARRDGGGNGSTGDDYTAVELRVVVRLSGTERSLVLVGRGPSAGKTRREWGGEVHFYVRFLTYVYPTYPGLSLPPKGKLGIPEPRRIMHKR